MPDLQAVPIQKLIWEERGRLGVEERAWGLPPCYLQASRKGGWAVLSKGAYGLPTPKVVELGKAT